jgi:hypothetical protein
LKHEQRDRGTVAATGERDLLNDIVGDVRHEHIVLRIHRDASGSQVGWRTSQVYRWIDINVYRKSIGRDLPTWQMRRFCGISRLRAYYHQQYLAKNPDGYCGIGGCGVPFKSAELYEGQKA